MTRKSFLKRLTFGLSSIPLVTVGLMSKTPIQSKCEHCRVEPLFLSSGSPGDVLMCNGDGDIHWVSQENVGINLPYPVHEFCVTQQPEPFTLK
jgi:hypothetical protein